MSGIVGGVNSKSGIIGGDHFDGDTIRLGNFRIAVGTATSDSSAGSGGTGTSDGSSGAWYNPITVTYPSQAKFSVAPQIMTIADAAYHDAWMNGTSSRTTTGVVLTMSCIREDGVKSMDVNYMAFGKSD